MISTEALAAIGVRDRALTAEAFATLTEKLRRFDHPTIGQGWSGVVIDMTQFADDGDLDDK